LYAAAAGTFHVDGIKLVGERVPRRQFLCAPFDLGGMVENILQEPSPVNSKSQTARKAVPFVWQLKDPMRAPCVLPALVKMETVSGAMSGTNT